MPAITIPATRSPLPFMRQNNIAELKGKTQFHQYLKNPVTMLVFPTLTTGLFISFITICFTGEFRYFLLYYFTPPVFPFTIFILERIKKQQPNTCWLLDVFVVIVSLIRAVYPIPFISGHAFFLTYALLTLNSKIGYISAFLVLLQVGYLKIFVWHDFTLLGGILVGIFVSVIYKNTSNNNKAYVHKPH